MAVINNLKATLSSFKINDVSTSLKDNIGTYGTADILNGGELLENTLTYTFSISGLNDHTIKSVVIQSLLLNEDGSLCTTKNITMACSWFSSKYSGNFITSDSTKTLVPTTFEGSVDINDSPYEMAITVSMNSAKSCYYGLANILINLSDIDYAVNINFTGPATSRTASSIKPAILLIKLGSVNVTFSKDPTTNYDLSTDSVEGRLYFKKNGIFVDGYQYGINVTATDLVAGVVKLQNTFERDDNDSIIAPTNIGVAASPQLIYEAILEMAIQATTETPGIVTISKDSFDIDEDGGLVAPTETGIAASPQLVYNALATAKTYTDTLTNFSDDFIRKDDTKLYIKWVSVNEDGTLEYN